MTFLIPVLFASSIFAQEEVTFRSSVVQVRVDAQVTENNRPVTGLTKDDFVIYDEGAIQPLVYFGHEAEPVTVMLLLDVSGSMKRYLEEVGRTARQALGQLTSRDRAGVMVFSKGTEVFHSFSNRFAEVAREIEVAVLDAKMPAGTAIYASLIDAATEFQKDTSGVQGRRAVLMVTDGSGLNHLVTQDDAVKALSAANAVMNSIVVGKTRNARVIPGGNPDFSPSDVFAVAERTGGEAIRAERADQAFTEMIGRLRTRYSLAFALPAAAKPGEFRRLRVELAATARRRYPRAQIRARTGYQLNP
jgi:VWFA-related protein